MATENISKLNFSKMLKSNNFSSPIIAEVLVIGGGGGGAGDRGGGGGAGGVNYSKVEIFPDSNYLVQVGEGGRRGGGHPLSASGVAGIGRNGGNSFFANIIAYGGGGGGAGSNSGGSNGGSGGGGAGPGLAGGTAFFGQGNNGGSGSSTTVAPGGGGGAGGAGGNGTGVSGNGGVGTAEYSSWGLATSSGQNISSTYYFAGGGGGGKHNDGGGGAAGSGGSGGGGNGIASSSSVPADSGLPNTGGGGGGGSNLPRTYGGGHGGSGIVIVRYSDSYPDALTVGGTKYTSGGYKYYKFNESGSFRLVGSSNIVTNTSFPISNFVMESNYSDYRSAQPGCYFVDKGIKNATSYLFAVSSTDWSQDSKTSNAFAAGPTTPANTYWRYNGSGNTFHDDIQLYFAGKQITVTNLTYYTYPASDYALDNVAFQYWNGSSWVTTTGLGYSSLTGWSTSSPGSAGSYNPVTFTYSGTNSAAETFKSKYWRIYFPPNCLINPDGIHGHGANNLNFLSFE
jgi:hypothetical protein